jgi:hypothetical protein
VFTARYVLHSTFCQQCIYVFCVDLRVDLGGRRIIKKKTGFYNRDGLSVYCTVRTGSLNIMAQEANRCSFTAEARVRSSVSQSEIYGG